ncbi:MAG: hypothetical protein BWY37_02229 [Firmicutes bacterium ADurb.Bin262]|nr:MAG: hypothetical protein BWY37_02229 [Firmicutes bacterium ADurb.Bin262]
MLRRKKIILPRGISLVKADKLGIGCLLNAIQRLEGLNIRLAYLVKPVFKAAYPHVSRNCSLVFKHRFERADKFLLLPVLRIE